jgi:hypothetical protein
MTCEGLLIHIKSSSTDNARTVIASDPKSGGADRWTAREDDGE